MSKRILIIDDSFYMRTILKNILTDKGYEVVGEAPNGSAALQLASELSPDLITLDVILPDTTGLELLKRFREDNQDAKVVMVSAMGQESVVNEALENGAQAYIIKPFSEEKVVKIIGNVFNPN